MEEGKERLTETARKAKRNLWVFAVIAAAIAFGWVELGDNAKVSLTFIRMDTTLTVILLGLLGLLAFNLASFWLHGPFGDSRRAMARCWVMDRSGGPRSNPAILFDRIIQIAGQKALRKIAKSGPELENWMLRNVEHKRWGELSGPERVRMLNELWGHLGFIATWRLRVSATFFQGRQLRLLMIEDLMDVWLPVVIGVSGAAAAVLAFWTAGACPAAC